jgi:hypothetical protein
MSISSKFWTYDEDDDELYIYLSDIVAVEETFEIANEGINIDIRPNENDVEKLCDELLNMNITQKNKSPPVLVGIQIPDAKEKVYFLGAPQVFPLDYDNQKFFFFNKQMDYGNAVYNYPEYPFIQIFKQDNKIMCIKVTLS